ncbi:neutral zinc metallopeptidase [Rhodococcus sp. GXMU-t2271]|nr:neutral zinc metallopeptidase [Rhodococcus ruber]
MPRSVSRTIRLAAVAVAAAVPALGAVAPAAAEDEAALQQLSPTAECPFSAESTGQYTTEMMGPYVQCFLPSIESWIDATYTDMPHPTAYYAVAAGTSGEAAPGCAYNENSLMYCAADRSLYIGEKAAAELVNGYGEIAVAAVLSHEVTHHFQTMLALPQPDPAEPNSAIPYENQADCGSGAFVAYSERDLGVTIEQADLASLGRAFAAVGEDKGPERTHGTVEQRIQAFDTGYLSPSPTPLLSCVDYVPDAPLAYVG